MAAPGLDGLQTIDVFNRGISFRSSRSSLGRLSSIRQGSRRQWGIGPDNVFARNSDLRTEEEDDEEALKWAALEKLPTYDRVRTTILNQMKGSRILPQQIDLRTIGPADKEKLIGRLFADRPEDDNEQFIRRMRDRVAKVDVKLPTVEVRYEDLTIEAEAHVAGRSLPTLLNVARNTVESWLEMLGLPITKKTTLAILKNVSGVVKPRRLTLLLGPPASGKTTLLLALAGRLAKNLKKTGLVTYNGYKLDEFVPQKTAAYISQHDLHVAEMTVRETLDFSARCQGVGERYDLLTELLHREKELGILPDPDVDFFMKGTAMKEKSSGLVTDYVLKILGLDICADTFVGDDMRRGISGGQKKRVTTGEMIVGPMQILFMDEISTGLDSSTTFQIIKCLRDVTHMGDQTMIISLLQPAPETYNLFDDIILLSEGEVVYHGPREHILEFFESCGYKCPERKGVADFLQEVTSKKDQRQYWADKSRAYQYTPVHEFAAAYKKYEVGQVMAQELAVPFNKAESHPAALTFEKYSVSRKELFMANFEKELLLMKRNSFIYIFKGTQIFIMGLIAMTVFFRTTMHRRNLQDAQVYAGALFFGVVNIMFNGFAELSMTIVRLPVFYKQRDLYFFPPWTFSLPKFIQSIPISILESTIWIVLTYYTIGFAPNVGRFFRQFFLYFWVHQMASSLFRLIAGICRTMIIANTGGSLALLVVFVLGGFLIPRTAIKPWWIWGYWISPLAYAQNAIDVNEFLAPEWNHYVSGETNPQPHTLGIQFLKNAGLFPRGYWYWLTIGVMIGYTVLFNLGFTFVLSVLDPIGGPQATVEAENEEEKIRELMEGSTVRKSGIGSASTVRRSSLSTAGPSTEEPAGSNVIMRQVSKVRNSMTRRRSSDVSVSTQSAREAIEAVDEATGERKRGMVLPFQPLAISFDDVNYYVDLPREMKAQGAETEDNRLQLLRRVTGAFRPGVLTALVGVSGAGKSTLMDVLAGRKTGGYIEGDIRISGFPKVQATFARISGYCEQNDIHSPQVTVHESLEYSAWLRLPADIDKATRRMFVLQVMELVELTPLRNAIVGLPGVTGLSTEQRKRLTIAVELVANPSIIFMDEPTSGLDARAAAIVMRCVRNTVDTGRTVVCTIHQPSIDIFEAFDELLLMKRGGQAIYAGPLGRHSHKLIEYFEAIPGVPKITEGYNPATWMLEVSSVGVEHRLGVDFAELYEKSALYERNKEMVKTLSVPAPDSKDLWFPTQFSQPMFTQIQACLWKQNLTYWRSPDYNNVRYVFTVVAALLFGTIFWQMGKKRNEQTSLFSIMGAMFGAVLFIGVNNSSTVQPVVSTERTVFYRERAAGMYSAIPYAIGQVLVEIPYCLVQTIIYATITYAMIALQWTAVKFFWYIFFMFFTFLYFTYYGMMAVGLTPNHQVASIVAAFFYAVFNLFSGFLISKTRIPAWWIWYYWICPVAWTLYGIIVSQFGDLTTLPLLENDGTQTTVSQFVEDNFGFKHSFLPVVAVIIVVFPLLFATVFMFAIKFLNFQRR
ncbi:unnamed protein product [Calypogeia fissa]